MRKTAVLLVVFALILGAIFPAFAQDRPSIPEWLTNDGRFGTLLAAVEAAGLGETLSGEGPFTVLAPTDDAFAAALETLGLTVEDVVGNPDLLTAILTYHVLPDRYFFRSLTAGPSIATVQGEEVDFNLEAGAFTVNGVTILDVDNVASNGIVHVLEDGVLVPPSIAATLAPAPEPTPEPTEAPAAEAPSRPSIAQVLTDDAQGRFTTLLAAVDAAGLTETLAGEGNFTVLAPTNDAFAAALEFLGLSAEDLLANPEALTAVLTYHVLPERYFFRDLIRGLTADSVNGAPVSFFENARGFLTANGAVISDVDNVAGNGVVQVLDSVILPPGVFPPAMVRVAHLSPDAPAVDVFINTELSGIQGLEYGSITDWVEIAPNPALLVAVAPAGTEDAVIGPVSLSFAPGSYTTIAAIGSAANGTLTAQAIAEDYSDIPANSARVTLFHAIEGAPAVNVLASGSLLVGGLAYPGTADGNDGAFTVTVPAGTYNLAVNAAGAPILTLDGAELVAGINYFVAAIGTPDNPSLLVQPTDTSGM